MASTSKPKKGKNRSPARLPRRKRTRVEHALPNGIPTAHAQARLAAIVESSDDAIISKDLNSIVTSWNRGAEKLFGYTAAEAVGRPITIIIPEERRNEETDILQRIRNGETVDHYETVRQRKDGALLDISLTVSPIRDKTGRIIGASKIARDVTDQKRAQEALRTREQMQRLLAEIGMLGTRTALMDAAQLEGMIQPICEKILVELNVSRCGFSQIEMDAGEVTVGQEAHSDFAPLKGTYRLSDYSPLFLAHGLSGRTTVFDDLATEPSTAGEYKQRYEPLNIRAIVTVPLRRHGQWVGTLWVSSHERRHWTESEVELIQSVADRLWSFLEQARFAKAADEGARQQEALYRFANRLQHTTTADDVYQAALDATREALNCERASILLFDPKGVMRFVAWRGLSDAYRQAVEGHSPWTSDASDPEPIYINDIAIAYMEDSLKRVITRERIAALAFIPLVSDRKLIGKFMTYYDEPRVFTRAEVDLGLTISRQLAFAIQRKRAEEMLRHSEQRLRLATETGKVGAWEWDIAANRVSWSDSLFGMHGVTKEEFDGTVEGFASLVHPEDRELVSKAIEQSVRTKEPYELTFRALKPNGETVWLFTNAVVVRDGAQAVRMIGATTDVTELKEAEQALERAKHEAEEANRAKDQFLAMLSHELRTPLTPVLMAATALETDENVSGELRDQLAMMRRNIELEARLIDDLLDITRIAHGKLELHEELVDVHAAIDHALNISASGVHGKKLQITKQLDANQYYCRADAARLQEVFWNILRNAVKFTPENGRIELITRNEGDAIVIAFADNGIGIEPELQPRIFDAFAQGEPAIRARFGGLGLGLAISKRIIDLHGGVIEVHSAGRGQGSTFSIRMPFAQRVPLETPAPPQIDLVPSAPAQILIVEDHEDTARVLSRILKNSGYGVTVCANLTDAQKAAAGQQFDLVVSDLGLPDGSGLDLMRQLRDSHGIRGIALSGFGTAEDLEQSKAAGFAIHLTKPVDVSRLRMAISQVLKGESAQSAAQTR